MFEILDSDPPHDVSTKAARERGGLCRVRDVLPTVLESYGVQLPRVEARTFVTYATDSSALVTASAAC